MFKIIVSQKLVQWYLKNPMYKPDPKICRYVSEVLKKRDSESPLTKEEKDVVVELTGHKKRWMNIFYWKSTKKLIKKY